MEVSSLTASSSKAFSRFFSTDSLLHWKGKSFQASPRLLVFSTRTAFRLSHGLTGAKVQKHHLSKVLCSQKKDVCIVEARNMDEIYDILAERLAPTAAAASNPNLKYVVCLAGPPGAGKSTLASEVVKRVNKLWSQKASLFDSQAEPTDIATVLPMDGFHLYRSQLDAMEDPEEAHARRGAPWTFNPELLLTCLRNLRDQGSVYAPSFDHGVGDPVEDDIFA